MSRRSRRSVSPALLVWLALALLAWNALTGPARLPHVAAALILGAAAGAGWGLAAGWRFRGRVDRAIRRALGYLIWRWGVRVTVHKEDWWSS